MHQRKAEKCPCKSWDLLQERIYNSAEQLRWRFWGKIVYGFYPLTIFGKRLHRSCLTEFLICLLATLINLDFVTLFFLSIFFWKFQKIHEQLLLKALKKLEVLSKTIRKIHERHPSILSETSIEWSLLLDRIDVGYCNTVSVGSRTL